MARVNFTSHLKRFFPGLDTHEVSGTTVAEVIDNLDKNYSGLKDYVVEENGRLRQHVNIFVGDSMITDRISLSDKVQAGDELFIMQALSGG